MIDDKAFKNYFGGKNGNGTYQTIINHIPPHISYYSLYLGNCAVTRMIKSAKYAFLLDLDPGVISAWQNVTLPENYRLFNGDALDTLLAMASFPHMMNGGEYIKREDCFIYLDPPYRKDSRKCKADVYKFEVEEKHHTRLLQLVTAMDGFKIMISHYPDPVYDQALKGWKTKDFYSMTRAGRVLERIYMNYDISDNLLHDYSYIGKDFRERERFERIRKNMLLKLDELPPILKNALISDIISQ